MSSIHPDIYDRLLSYLDGCLDENLRREVRAHLERCGPCSEELAVMKAMMYALRQAGQDDLAVSAESERYGCPGAEDLTLHEAQEASHPRAGGEWIARHLEACPRCQHEVDLIRLLTLQLSESSGTVTPQSVAAQVEERLIARVRQGRDEDHRTAVRSRWPSLSPSFLWRAALGVGCAAAVAAWGIMRLQSDQVLVTKRSSDQDVRVVQSFPSSPAGPQQQSQGTRERSTLPPLVPAKQGEILKVLILPTSTRLGLRSAVAAGLGDHLKAVQPSKHEFPPEPSVDDLTANRRLGRLFGVRYILEIDVKKQRSGHLVMLRAADTETGGVVAEREEHTLEERALATVAGRLARELQQELLARP